MKAKKTKQPMPIRTCRVTIRLTETDRAMFKEKANASFNGNISKLIFTSVSLYKNDRMKSKYATAQRFADLYDQLLPELKKGGTNLNQVAHQLNAAMLQYMGEQIQFSKSLENEYYTSQKFKKVPGYPL